MFYFKLFFLILFAELYFNTSVCIAKSSISGYCNTKCKKEGNFKNRKLCFSNCIKNNKNSTYSKEKKVNNQKKLQVGKNYENKSIEEKNKKNINQNKTKNILKRTSKISAIPDNSISSLIDFEQTKKTNHKKIKVNTKNKGVYNLCIPKKKTDIKKEKKINKALENAKDELKDHIKTSLIRNNVREEIINYVVDSLKFSKKAEKKNNEIKKRTMMEAIEKYDIQNRGKTGKVYKKMYKEALNEITDIFNVEANILLTIWAMETSYGSFIGNYNAFTALYSASMNSTDIQRLRYFENNLIHLSKLVDEGVFAKNVVSSFDGGLGGCQFMPDSVYKYALSLRGGKPDIINKNEDVLASIGNYLYSMGWRYNDGILTEITLPNNFDKCLIGMNTIKTIKEWKKLGIIPHKNGIGKEYMEDDNKLASVILTDIDNDDIKDYKKRAFLVYDNFKVILTYNPRLQYGIISGLIYEEIGNDLSY